MNSILHNVVSASAGILLRNYDNKNIVHPHITQSSDMSL